MIAILDTDAGDICFNESVSNINETGVGILSSSFYRKQYVLIGSSIIGNLIRSLDESDNNLLSSNAEFNASQFTGSYSPSKTIQDHIYGFYFLSTNLTASLQAADNAPSTHSFVYGSTYPNN